MNEERIDNENVKIYIPGTIIKSENKASESVTENVKIYNAENKTK